MDSEKRVDHNKNIVNLTAVIILGVVDAYVSLSYGELLHNLLSFINNSSVRELVLWVLQFAILGGSFGVVYVFVRLVYTLAWRIKHKKIWYGGTWLHIHDKEKIRIGTVTIKQNFEDLDVTATNVGYPATSDSKPSTWRYIGNQLPCGTNGNKLIGCYASIRGQSTKYGFHIFDNDLKLTNSSPTKLEGKFGDILKLGEENTSDISDRMGKLYLFKITPANKKLFKDYLSRRKELTDILGDKGEVSGTAFVKRLNMVVDKLECSRKLKRVREMLSGQITVEDIDVNLAKILCKIILCDKKIALAEREYLNDLLGTKWDDTYLKMIYNEIESQPDEFERSMSEFLKSLKTSNRLFLEFKTLVENAGRGLAHADNENTEAETECMDKIEKFFKNV